HPPGHEDVERVCLLLRGSVPLRESFSGKPMAQYDLCTLAHVKAWLGRSDSNSDALLTALITRTSRQLLSYLRRATILLHTVSEIRDGTGSQSLMLREWPVLSVSSLTIGAQTIAPAS